MTLTRMRRLVGCALGVVAVAVGLQLVTATGARAAAAPHRPAHHATVPAGHHTHRPAAPAPPSSGAAAAPARHHAGSARPAVHRVVAPIAVDGRCAPSGAIAPTVRIPADAGVRYRLDGVHADAGEHVVTPGRHRVRAVSTTYRLRHDVFDLSVRAASCAATPEPVTTAPKTGSGVTAPSGSAARPVTGAARAGDTAVRTWTSARSAVRAAAPCGANCVGPVVPAPAAFRDSTCVGSTGERSGASYTVPATRGVVYWVNGADVQAGTYPARDGSTLTVVVSAKAGYTLSGVTQWTHTFADAPACSQVAAAPAKSGASAPADPATRPATDTTHTPAYTGVDSRDLLLIGLALLALGAAACVAGSRRAGIGTSGSDGCDDDTGRSDAVTLPGAHRAARVRASWPVGRLAKAYAARWAATAGYLTASANRPAILSRS